jgi:hypothetical protein
MTPEVVAVPECFLGAGTIHAYAVGVAEGKGPGARVLSLSARQHDCLVRSSSDGFGLLATLHQHGYVEISIRIGGEGGAEP